VDGYIGATFGLGVGTLFIVLGAPLARRAIGPNRWYGYRLRITLENDDAWYAVKAQTGRHLVIIGAILIGCGVAGLAALHDPRQQLMLVIICLVITMLGLGNAVVDGYRTAKERKVVSQPEPGSAER